MLISSPGDRLPVVTARVAVKDDVLLPGRATLHES